MSVNRDKLKEMIAFIHKDDAAEVYNLISYLNLKREKNIINQLDLDILTDDKKLFIKYKKVIAPTTN